MESLFQTFSCQCLVQLELIQTIDHLFFYPSTSKKDDLQLIHLAQVRVSAHRFSITMFRSSLAFFFFRIIRGRDRLWSSAAAHHHHYCDSHADHSILLPLDFGYNFIRTRQFDLFSSDEWRGTESRHVPIDEFRSNLAHRRFSHRIASVRSEIQHEWGTTQSLVEHGFDIE